MHFSAVPMTRSLHFVPANLLLIPVLSSKYPRNAGESVRGRRFWVSRLILLLGSALLLASCGGGVGDIRVLQTITVTPTEANAPSSGNVRFSAMGTYNKA